MVLPACAANYEEFRGVDVNLLLRWRSDDDGRRFECVPAIEAGPSRSQELGDFDLPFCLCCYSNVGTESLQQQVMI